MGLTGWFAIMKYVVVIFNLIFWLAGIAVVAISVWLYIDSTAYLQNTDDSFLYFTAVFILMAAGAVMFFIGLLGCCGALQESPVMLSIYFIFLLVIFMAEVSGAIWAWLHIPQLGEMIEGQVTKMVKDEYGLSKTVNKTIDAMQHDLGCCGAMQPNDWAYSRFNSKENSAIEVGVPKSTGFYYVPTSCCNTSIVPEECEIRRKLKFSGQTFEGLYKEGCVPRLQQYFTENTFTFYGVAIGVGVIELLGLLLSMVLCCAVRT